LLTLLTVTQTVEIYNVEESEILLFDDSIQVKGQKSERNSRSESTTHTPSPDTTKDKTPAVITDVAMLQTPKGGFEYLVAPLNTEVEEPISLATVVRARILALYQKESKPFEYCCYHQWGKSYSPSPLSYTEHGHKLRILKIRDNIVKIEKVVKRLRND